MSIQLKSSRSFSLRSLSKNKTNHKDVGKLATDLELQGFGEHHGLSTDSMFTDMNPGYKGSTTRNVTKTQPKTNRILWEEMSIRERSKPRPLTSGQRAGICGSSLKMKLLFIASYSYWPSWLKSVDEVSPWFASFFFHTSVAPSSEALPEDWCGVKKSAPGHGSKNRQVLANIHEVTIYRYLDMGRFTKTQS